MDWKDYEKEQPKKKHIKLGTQFLVKGYYQIGDRKGEACYHVSRAVDFLMQNNRVYLDSPLNFNILEWCHIKD